MARKKDGIARMKLMITEDPEGTSYLQMSSEDLTLQLSVRELTVVDLRQPAKVIEKLRPAPAAKPDRIEGS
jgi:hypothetical protein